MAGNAYKANKEYALYKGEEIIAMGTAFEIAEELGVKVSTVLFYNTNTHKKRIAGRKSKNARDLVLLDDDDEFEED